LNNLIKIIAIMMLVTSCNLNYENQPLSGSDWGDLRNGSAEEVASSTVLHWTPESRQGSADHFYSLDAKSGSKSLRISSTTPSSGRWTNKVNLKPWSKYKFSGWIKTIDLVPLKKMGAGIRLEGLKADVMDFSGSSEWTPIEIEFETGNQDACTLACVFSLDGMASGTVLFDDMKFELISTEDFNPGISIDLADLKEPMSDYIYGQFIEHLGKCIYGGIWAEMIEDRKFYYAPGEQQSPWKFTGDDSRLTIDRKNPYVGDLSPILNNSSTSNDKLIQRSLGLRDDVSYDGRIIFKVDKDIKQVEVTLSSGNYSETVFIKDFKVGYKSYDLTFNPGVASHNATIEISGKGTGKLYIGTVSLMPADNIKGFRKDVLGLLKELNSPIYRWPGGNFVSGYDWHDGIGPRDLRPPRKNPAWKGVEHNDVGMHEFIEFCKLIETEPYIAVNAGLGGAEEARKQVEYCNGSQNTPMGKLRTKNGDSEAWNVKWWSIGNEMYGGWQLGHMSTEAFVEKHNEFASAMKTVDKDIVLVAVGDVGPWDEMIMANCSDNMDLISEHFYRQDWHGGGLLSHINQIPDAIRSKAEAHRKYREDIPGLAEKDIRICLDEYNYWYGPYIYGELGTRYFLRDALGIAAGINEFSRQSDIIYMANYAQTVNVIGCIKTNTTHSVMAATGQVLKLYGNKFRGTPVTIAGETRPFDIAALLNKTSDTLSISIVNPTWEKQSLDIDLLNTETNGAAEIWSVCGPNDMAYNEPGKPEKVIIRGPDIISRPSVIGLEPYSASIIRIPIKVSVEK
jgi:alpha-N-arabinofuranosidase